MGRKKKVSNTTTQEAVTELEEGGGKRADNVDELMEELNTEEAPPQHVVNAMKKLVDHLGEPVEIDKESDEYVLKVARKNERKLTFSRWGGVRVVLT